MAKSKKEISALPKLFEKTDTPYKEEIQKAFESGDPNELIIIKDGNPLSERESEELVKATEGQVFAMPTHMDITHMQAEPETVTQKVIRISQSLMKSVREYLEGGSCGILLKEKYIKGRLFDDATKSMRLGTYFEYILTGALPKNGKKPEPEYMKSAIIAQAAIVKANAKAVEQNKKIVNDNVLIRQFNAHLKPGKKPKKVKELKEIKPEKVLSQMDMYEPYREAHVNATRLLMMWNEIGLEIATGKDGQPLVGWKVTKGRFDGVIDVVLRATRDITFANGKTLKEGDLISGDIKYSGLADDKYSVHGWQWTEIQKRYHGTQAKQYGYLTSLPQTFWIVDPGGKYILFFWCDINEAAIEQHLAEGNELHKRLIELDELGALEPRPEFNRCEDCPLNSECTYKHTFPHPVKVDLTV